MKQNITLDSTLDALRAVGEHTRLRILLLCAHGELTVGDLTNILEQSQPRVSRHLKLMHDAGVLERHQEGQNVWFRAALEGAMANIIRTVVDQVDYDDPIHAADLERLKTITHTWQVRAQSYFRKNFAKWDQLRRELVDEEAVDTAIKSRFESSDARTLLDIGTGTGHILRLLGPKLASGIGIDTSRDMLLAARAAIHHAGMAHCQVRQGDMNRLPFEDASFDALSLHLVLHFANDPAKVLAECGRVAREGGNVYIVDFARHERRELTRIHGHRWPGFGDDEVSNWLVDAGFSDVESTMIGGSEPGVVLWTASRQPTETQH